MLYGYNITGDPSFLDEHYGMVPELKKKIVHYYQLAMEGKQSNIQKLLDAIERYPQNPQLKNYLSILYRNLGWEEKGFETNHWILAEHPDYLYARLNLANEYYLRGQYEKMKEVLGDLLEIKALYPERDTFHISEVLSFHKTAILYYTAVGEFEQAEIRYRIMKDIDPDSEQTVFVRNRLLISGLQDEEDEKIERAALKKRVQGVPNTASAQSELLVFIHDKIKILYKAGFEIDPVLLDTILALPRESLILDLLTIIQDSKDRYLYYRSMAEMEGWGEDRLSFLSHAMFLMAEIEAEEGLDAMLDILAQDQEFIRFYLGEVLTEELWKVFFRTGKNQLGKLMAFMRLPGVDTYSKATIIDCLEKIWLQMPEKREEVNTWFRDLAVFFNSCPLDYDIIDSEVIAFFIWSILNINLKDLIPEIEKLYDKGWVAEGICGSYESVLDEFDEPVFPDGRKLQSIKETYAQIISNRGSYTSTRTNPDYGHDLSGFHPTLKVTPSGKLPGRNDPCPCGSGKKYKKCCGKAE